eukprot:4091404-Amphidinium_carterae.1
MALLVLTRRGACFLEDEGCGALSAMVAILSKLMLNGQGTLYTTPVSQSLSVLCLENVETLSDNCACCAYHATGCLAWLPVRFPSEIGLGGMVLSTMVLLC